MSTNYFVNVVDSSSFEIPYLHIKANGKTQIKPYNFVQSAFFFFFFSKKDIFLKKTFLMSGVKFVNYKNCETRFTKNPCIIWVPTFLLLKELVTNKTVLYILI